MIEEWKREKGGKGVIEGMKGGRVGVVLGCRCMVGRGVKGEKGCVGMDDVDRGWGGWELEEGEGGGVRGGNEIGKDLGGKKVDVMM